MWYNPTSIGTIFDEDIKLGKGRRYREGSRKNMDEWKFC
jgi:hypothetical protein